MEEQEHRPEKAAAPPDAAGHRGAQTRPEDVTEEEPLEERHPPPAEDPSREARPRPTEEQEHRSEKRVAPPDAVIEEEALEQRRPPPAEAPSQENRGARRRLPPAFPLGSTFLLLLLLAAVLALVAYLLGLS